ncbi:MAG TPA: hypothetical protein VI461_05305 [Chitinophagaceae bacterium]|nr:hypothetical protein [Chitinophagaceae bacterium]
MQEQDTRHDSVSDTKDPLKGFRQQKQDTIMLDSSVKISNKVRIEVLSINKFMDSAHANVNSFKIDKIKCSEWSLSKENIKTIISVSEAIDSHELHYMYDVYPCYFIGEITVNGKHAGYTINAGAFSIIEFKDTSLILGYKKPDYKKYFLLGPGIE